MTMKLSALQRFEQAHKPATPRALLGSVMKILVEAETVKGREFVVGARYYGADRDMVYMTADSAWTKEPWPAGRPGAGGKIVQDLEQPRLNAFHVFSDAAEVPGAVAAPGCLLFADEARTESAGRGEG
jgi:hypothetical protein